METNEECAMRLKLGYIVCYGLLVTLGGCATTPPAQDDTDAQYISHQLEQTLVTLSNKAVEAKEITLAHQAAMARFNPQVNQQPPNMTVPPGLEKVIPLKRKFYGDAREAIALIEMLTNYEVKFRGVEPTGVVLWVSLKAQSNRTAIDLLDDIANQIDKRNVNIDVWPTPNSKKAGVILISYVGGE